MLKGLRISLLAAVAAAMLAVPAFAQAPIKIGVLTPLSPPGDAGAGQLIVRGAKMGADEVNASGGILGGRKIELVIEDDAGTPEKGVAGLRKLASQDKVSAVIGQFHSSVMEATQDLAEQLKVPIFSTQASAKKITEKHLTYTFRTHVIDPDRVALWNKWIVAQGFKRVAILAENTDYGIGLSEETKKQFASSGVKAELKSIIFDRAVVDLTPQVLEIKNWKPDLLINIGLGTQMYIIIKQAFDVGLDSRHPHADLLRRAGPGGVLEERGREGRLRRLHRLLPPDHEAHAAGRGLPQSLPRPVQGAAGLRGPQRLRAGHAARRCHDRGQERQDGRSPEVAHEPTSSRAGTGRFPSRAARVPTGSSGARPSCSSSMGKRTCPSQRQRSSSPRI